MLSKLALYYNTLKYLKPMQIYFRGFYFLKNRVIGNKFKLINFSKNSKPLTLLPSIVANRSYVKEAEFTFLNVSQNFERLSKIDWNYPHHGKLWCYNLNYFDFLNQKDLSPELGLQLIRSYIQNSEVLKDGLEPYPISLRNINWIKFLTLHKRSDQIVDDFLYSTYRYLYQNLEYHLMGNHLLENAFSLLYGAYYFEDETLFKKADKLLRDELNEQVLKDGAHFELSPMYHQILLFRLLDCINLTQNNWNKSGLNFFLQQKASLMLSWLRKITFTNGSVPHVNDSVGGIAPATDQLFRYAHHLKIPSGQISLCSSGYRLIQKKNYELFIDIGHIGPDYIPGHAHSDTFNFILNINEKPVVIDTAISTYEIGPLRDYQRSTAAHNTVMVGNTEQSHVWAGFRVGRRAKVFKIEENERSISARHNGYKKLGIIHQREWLFRDEEITIIDTLENGKNRSGKSFIHFDHTVDPQIIDNQLTASNFTISFVGDDIDIRLQRCHVAYGFNRVNETTKAIVTFRDKLKMTITLT
ncbi:hypothetical protein C900_03111 [Fulvivirga imtechensis AK7]|uniref:Uncharacterized protein n=1 Tax=Fulvivirga imtechensis AK7 TaxID=1237149 RepID=L8JPU5_9BACT|nr:alginate lyase family protein [Fulvivirga imtechensis]ELR70981.1 hypothetical protein C900_03111 [Fulvivirga imtechensis AK7]